jgi:cytochrome c biogenesis protein CcmG/thiol:disulfide interchange protein DsbE
VPTTLGSRRLMLSLAAIVVAGVVAAAVILVGTRGAGSTSTAAGVAGNGPARQGETAPTFHGTGIDGQSVNLATLRGKVVIVNFFATWCNNCVAEMPLLQRAAHDDAARGLVVVGVNWHETGDARAFVRRLGVTFATVLDQASVIGDAYGVIDLPESVFIDRAGRVTTVFRGQLSDSTLQEALAPLLG